MRGDRLLATPLSTQAPPLVPGLKAGDHCPRCQSGRLRLEDVCDEHAGVIGSELYCLLCGRSWNYQPRRRARVARREGR